ncbi:E3 ubiquitin-protein ligase XIAP-like isoform X2 [Dreissena polymorpha]|uniref:E3 ubiquitin-protein ligase XIAP-like isoform X2 n=1 Tax=Dreissena polymorpha TaxID=45954 RepID=UPI0022654B47|nr:E3 ubiquitin-protein ligase XIAP-like isoform X2 [Dreissena polymorpha]
MRSNNVLVIVLVLVAALGFPVVLPDDCQSVKVGTNNKQLVFVIKFNTLELKAVTCHKYGTTIGQCRGINVFVCSVEPPFSGVYNMSSNADLTQVTLTIITVDETRAGEYCCSKESMKESTCQCIKVAGFFYASDGDGVVCYCCGIRRYSCVEVDDPMEVHKRIYPRCKFIINNSEHNVPAISDGPLRQTVARLDMIPEFIRAPSPGEDVNNSQITRTDLGDCVRYFFCGIAPTFGNYMDKNKLQSRKAFHTEKAGKYQSLVSFEELRTTQSKTTQTKDQAHFDVVFDKPEYEDC